MVITWAKIHLAYWNISFNKLITQRMSSYIHILPAQHGDAIIIHCTREENNGVVVVDGGPSSNIRLNPFLSEIEKLNHIDLMVLTHHDDDHIKGILHYIKRHKDDNPFPVTEIWANCAKNITIAETPELTAFQAKSLSEYLENICNGADMRWRSDICSDMPIIETPFCSIEVIGPTRNTYANFMTAYAEKIDIECEISEIAAKDNSDKGIDCHELACRTKETPNPDKYDVLTNMASISVIPKCDGLSVLLLGDSFPQEIAATLISKGYSIENKLKVDYIKIAHHGSRNNTSNELLDLIDCDNYIFLTNGGLGKARHPQRETLANILCHAERDMSRTVHFYFNYPIATIQRYGNVLFNEELDKDLNYCIHEPNSKDISNPGYRLPAYE